MSVTAAYLNGKWVAAAELVVPVDDVGFMLGATVSERLRTFGGQVFRPAEHLQRLAHSLDVIGLDGAAISGEVEGVLDEVARRGRAPLEAGDDIGIVVFVTPPTGRAGRSGAAYGMLAVYAAPLAFGDWAGKYREGQRLVLSSHRQVPPTCWPSELKCRSRMHYYLADQEAQRRDGAARALVLDQMGRVAEASTANLLIVRGGTIVSPLLDYILPGVSLAFVPQLAAAEGIPMSFDEVWPADLADAEEVLLASTSPCLLPVCHCDGRPIGAGQPGPVFHQLLEAWGKHVGVDIRQQAERFAVR